MGGHAKTGVDGLEVRLIAVDLDGTVLKRSGAISRRTRRALALARRRGVTVSVATGRSPAGARLYAAVLGAAGPLICLDGALVFAGAEVLLDLPLKTEDAKEVVAMVEALGGGWIALTRRGRIHGGPSRRPPQATVGRVLKQPLGSYRFWRSIRLEEARWNGAVTDEPVYKLLLWAPAGDRRTELEKAVRTLPVHVPSGPGSTMEVVAPGVSKGVALAVVTDHLGLRREHVVAFGDGRNDAEMLTYAGRGVAMGDAAPEALAAADARTDGVQRDGLARELYRLLAGNPPPPGRNVIGNGGMVRAKGPRDR